MDPNETLNLIRRYTRQILSGEGTQLEALEVAEMLASRIADLDTYLSRGGHLQDGWANE